MAHMFFVRLRFTGSCQDWQENMESLGTLLRQPVPTLDLGFVVSHVKVYYVRCSRSQHNVLGPEAEAAKE